MDFSSASFLTSLMQVIVIDILLGGDNAIVIALACRRLPAAQRSRGIAWGTAGAIGLRVALIFFALQLLALPFLRIVGGLMLLWIGIKLLRQEDDDVHDGIESSTSLLGAIRTIVVADAAMSLDNVIAVAGAARGDLGLVVLGIVISIPIIVWGSKLVLSLMDRVPALIPLGAALLGWIGGDMLTADTVVSPYLAGAPAWLRDVVAVAGALFVVVAGRRHAGRLQTG